MSGKRKMPAWILILLVIIHGSCAQQQFYANNDEDLTSVTPPAGDTSHSSSATAHPDGVSSNQESTNRSLHSTHESKNVNHSNTVPMNESSHGEQKPQNAGFEKSLTAPSKPDIVPSVYALHVWVLVMFCLLLPGIIFLVVSIMYFFYKTKKLYKGEEDTALYSLRSYP